MWGCGVLFGNVAAKVKDKLADRLKEEIYEVLEQPNPDISVHRVRPEGKTGIGIWRGQNLLLRVSTIPAGSELKSGSRKGGPSSKAQKTQSDTRASEEIGCVRGLMK